MSVRFITALLLSIVCAAVPVWADFQAGWDAHRRGDYMIALREWQPLAEKGDAVAQYNLGLLYVRGLGVPQDYTQARKWFEKAAAQEFASAQTSLGTLYMHGYGVSQDHEQALYWFLLAADQGEALALVKLGVMYETGEGVPQDFVLAHTWYNLGGAKGEKKATEFRDSLAKKMTPAQIAEAQKLAREWKPIKK